MRDVTWTFRLIFMDNLVVLSITSSSEVIKKIVVYKFRAVEVY
jgi:hypothetical protein